MITFQGREWDLMKEAAPAFQQMGVSIDLLTPSEAVERIPVVLKECIDGAVFLPEDGHIDVHGLLWSYLRHARESGVELRFGVEVRSVRSDENCGCRIVTNKGTFSARWIVNAAGAWAGIIGQLAEATPIEFTPCRRTVITFGAPDGLNVGNWPLVADHTHHFYFSPESGCLLASPMDEEPMEPCDVRPDELVVAQTMEKLGKLTPSLLPKSLLHKWAGLRTFTSDRAYVIGADPGAQGFFWLAGQGGTGIETSPAAGQVAADLLIDGRTDLIDATSLMPERFA